MHELAPSRPISASSGRLNTAAARGAGVDDRRAWPGRSGAKPSPMRVAPRRTAAMISLRTRRRQAGPAEAAGQGERDGADSSSEGRGAGEVQLGDGEQDQAQPERGEPRPPARARPRRAGPGRGLERRGEAADRPGAGAAAGRVGGRRASESSPEHRPLGGRDAYPKGGIRPSGGGGAAARVRCTATNASTTPASNCAARAARGAPRARPRGGMPRRYGRSDTIAS